MLSNFLKIAFRNLKRNGTFSFINIFGLTLGTVCFLYILLFVQHHRSFDKHHRDGDRLFRVITDLDISNDGDIMHMATCSPPIPFAMMEDFPEVEIATRAVSHPALEQNLIRFQDRVFYERKGYYVDSTFFRMFDYHFLEGQPETALDQPNTVVISEQLAKKIFDTSPALDQIIRIGTGSREQAFTVKGVYDSDYGSSHLMPEFFMAMNSGGIGQYIRTSESWAGNNFIYGYIRLQPGTEPSTLENKLPAFLKSHGGDQFRQANLEKKLFLQPVASIHTTNSLDADMSENTGAKFLKILLLIAGFIQLVACINFMNLTTAKSGTRAREVGIRKTVGAPRATLIGQFLAESILIAALAMILAIPLLQMTMPYLHKLTGVTLFRDLSLSFQSAMLIGLLMVATGVLAGSYPAFYLSSFKPLTALRNKVAMVGGGRGILRKMLVIGQFSIAIVLVIGALVIRSQLEYLLEQDLGFEKNNKIIIPFHASESREHIKLFKQHLHRLPEIKSTASMSKYPGQQLINDLPLYKEGQDMSSAVDIRAIYIDDGFFETLKVRLLSGRTLTQADTTRDGQNLRVVINKTAADRLGLEIAKAPGQELRTDFENVNIRAEIVGVMEDIQYQNLANEMGPFMVIAEPADNLNYLMADISSENLPALLSRIEETWRQIVPEYPFEFSFLDENLNRLYHTERSLARIISLFTLITIVISCLGLFGLSVFAAEQRMKEIGIRKVLGASTAGIIRLLSFDFLRLVIVALLFAAPFAYYFSDRWLDEFAHRIPVTFSYFFYAAIFAISIAFFTVSFQSIRAALVNPAKSLQSE